MSYYNSQPIYYCMLNILTNNENYNIVELRNIIFALGMLFTDYYDLSKPMFSLHQFIHLLLKLGDKLQSSVVSFAIVQVANQMVSKFGEAFSCEWITIYLLLKKILSYIEDFEVEEIQQELVKDITPIIAVPANEIVAHIHCLLKTINITIPSVFKYKFFYSILGIISKTLPLDLKEQFIEYEVIKIFISSF